MTNSSSSSPKTSSANQPSKSRAQSSSNVHILTNDNRTTIDGKQRGIRFSVLELIFLRLLFVFGFRVVKVVIPAHCCPSIAARKKGVFGMKEIVFHGKCFPGKQVNF
ncbi:hypothetical protein H5410_059318 [Solanum commersonii]|uniref:Uncharacterized protein n=1 Tax=Solanum commersonii TaxID=4109 RepID=A0A9J5W2J0_SOLCO|nr:hypothetical protein H5410_059318 [Solanum commersonii]